MDFERFGHRTEFALMAGFFGNRFKDSHSLRQPSLAFRASSARPALRPATCSPVICLVVITRERLDRCRTLPLL